MPAPPPGPGPSVWAAWYAAALSAVQLGYLRPARRRCVACRGEVAGGAAARQARLLGAELELAAGDAPAALSYLEGQPAPADAEPAGCAQAPARTAAAHPGAVGAGAAAGMTAPLQTWLAFHRRPRRPGRPWPRCGSSRAALCAVRAEAEAQVAVTTTAAAVDRFKAGQDLARRGGAANDHIGSDLARGCAPVSRLRKEQAAERSTSMTSPSSE